MARLPEFGVYYAGPEIGVPVNAPSLNVTLLDLRADGTSTFELLSDPCFTESPLMYEARWVLDGDRLRLEGEEPGSRPEIWPSATEAWIEPVADSVSLSLSFIDQDGTLLGPVEYRPGCACVPDPTACCAMRCLELALEPCPQERFAAWCENP